MTRTSLVLALVLGSASLPGAAAADDLFDHIDRFVSGHASQDFARGRDRERDNDGRERGRDDDNNDRDRDDDRGRGRGDNDDGNDDDDD